MSTSPDDIPQGGIFQPVNALPLPAAAAHYAAMGLKIFPLQPGTKLPMQGWSWKRAATSDVDTVRSWWQQWPTANIGLAMGEGSGVDALDIDVKKGQDGIRSFQAITQEPYHGPIAQTPTGGQHLLFKHTAGLLNFTHRGQLGGLDLRTSGGYIVLAPSVTADGHYHWIRDGKVGETPATLLAAFRQWSDRSNTEVQTVPDIPESIPDISGLGLDAKYLNYLDHGDTGPWQHDESRALFATAGALMRRLQDSSLVFGILLANPFAWACADRHRPFGDPAEWLWKYGIAKIVGQATAKGAQDVFSPLPVVSNGSLDPDQEQPRFFTQGSRGMEKARLAPDWVVRGLMERGQVGLVYGDSQALKSYLMLDLAVDVSVGGEWHDFHVSSPGPVWFLAGEGNAILWRRLEARRQVTGMRSDELSDLWLSEQGLNLMDPKHLEFLKQQVEFCGAVAPRLLIVDTLSTNALLDENNARDVGELISICYHIAAEWGTTVILVHHVGKSNKTVARGSSVLQSNTDFRYRMERLSGQQRILTQLFVEKLKGAPEPRKPITFEATSHPLVGVLDDDMVPVTDLVLRRVSEDEIEDPEIIKAKIKLTNQQADIYDAVRQLIVDSWTISTPGDGMFREELWNRIQAVMPDVRNNNFYRTLEALANKGLLRMTEKAGSILFCLPGSPAAEEN